MQGGHGFPAFESHGLLPVARLKTKSTRVAVGRVVSSAAPCSPDLLRICRRVPPYSSPSYPEVRFLLAAMVAVVVACVQAIFCLIVNVSVVATPGQLTADAPKFAVCRNSTFKSCCCVAKQSIFADPTLIVPVVNATTVVSLLCVMAHFASVKYVGPYPQPPPGPAPEIIRALC